MLCAARSSSEHVGIPGRPDRRDPEYRIAHRTEIVALEGSRESGVEALRWRHRDSGAEETRAIRNCFLFLGADPATEWLKDCRRRLRRQGFVRTAAGGACRSRQRARRVRDRRRALRLGEARRRAIGEGAAAVAQIHAFLRGRMPGWKARAA